MSLAVVCFTNRGSSLCAKLVKELRMAGWDCRGYMPFKWLAQMGSQDDSSNGIFSLDESIQAWTGHRFADSDGLLFIGAAGIAVRSIAPFLRDKTVDPAVVVMDEKGQFAIPLLSGHLGGANELAMLLARLTGVVPVITTATDINGVFAVDVFAKKQDLALSDMTAAKMVSSDLLSGAAVGWFCDFPTLGQLPEGCQAGKVFHSNIWITLRSGRMPVEGETFADRIQDDSCHMIPRTTVTEMPFFLKLVPKLTILGIGCRKGTEEAVLEQAVMTALGQAGIALESVAAIATIDLKKEEAGLIAFAEKIKAGFYLYSAEQLSMTEGEFTASAFVKGVTGVDNVCERAALTYVRESAGAGILIMKKYAEHGVTVAAAVKEWKVVL